MIKPNSFSGWGGEEKDSSEWDGIGNEIEFKDVELSADGVAEIRTAEAPMAEGREDKRVDVVDESGVEKRTSNLMLGRNKREVQVGERYYSLEGLKGKVGEYLESDEEEVVFYVRRGEKGKRFCEPREVVDDIARAVTGVGPEMELAPSDKIVNQDARHVEAYGTNGERQSGVFMLGDMGIEMPNGAYVSAEAVEAALGNYLKAVRRIEAAPVVPPVVPPVGSEPGPVAPPKPSGEEPVETEKSAERGEDKEYRVIRRIRDVHRKWVLPVALATAMTLAALGGFGNDEAVATTSSAGFGVSTETAQTMQVEMTPEEAYKKVLEEAVFSVDTGGKMDMPVGVTYHESSDFGVGGANRTGTFGEGIRQPGEYTMEYISVLGKDGQIKEVEYREGKNLGEFVNEVAEKEGTPLEDLTIMVCIGGPESGWVDVADIARRKLDFTDEKELMKEIVISKDEQISGTVEDFAGTASFVTEAGETVELSFLREDGTMAEVGEMVKGSDGREYRVEDLSVTTTETRENRTTWSLADAAKVAAVAGGAAMVLGAMFGRKKKKKEMVDMTGAEIETLIRDSEESYEDGTEFEGRVEELLRKKEVEARGTGAEKLFKTLVGREVTVEEIEDLKKGEQNGN